MLGLFIPPAQQRCRVRAVALEVTRFQKSTFDASVYDLDYPAGGRCTIDMFRCDSHPSHTQAESLPTLVDPRRDFIVINTLGNSMLSEDSSRHRNDTLDSDRVVTSHTQHEATDLILNSQQMTQQAITKLVLSVEINGPLSGWTSTGSAQTVSTPPRSGIRLRSNT